MHPYTGLTPCTFTIRCYECREYDHFTKDCPTSREERELELQQMFNLDDEQTSLKPLVANMHGNSISSENNLRPGDLNLQKVGMTPLHLPPSTNKGGQVNTNRPKHNRYLTEEQARDVYKKVELGSIINTDTL